MNLKIDKVSFAWGKQSPLLKDVSFEISKGEIVSLIGPNGCGKTTLLRILLGLLDNYTGNVSFGDSKKKKSNYLGYVPQYLHVDSDFPVTVEKVIQMGLLGLSISRAERKKRVEEVMELLSLKSIANELFGQLSGGIRQRTLIARALVGNPDFLLLDEPTANVDLPSSKNLAEVLVEIKKKMGVLLVTHDVSFVAGVTDRVVCLHQSASVHSTSEVTPELLEKVFGEGVNLVHHHHGESHV